MIVEQNSRQPSNGLNRGCRDLAEISASSFMIFAALNGFIRSEKNRKIHFFVSHDSFIDRSKRIQLARDQNETKSLAFACFVVDYNKNSPTIERFTGGEESYEFSLQKSG